MKKLIALASILLLVSQGITAQAISGQAAPKNATKKVTYRASIDFISKGGGIDNETYGKIEKFIADHPKKPAFEVKQKGKEGEKVINLKLAELTKEEQKAFMDEIKKMVPNTGMVNIFENGIKQKMSLKATGLSGSIICRINISFISHGAGIDHASHEKIKEFIDKHPKKPAVIEQKWGREGELDYCLGLKELTADEQKAFVDEIKRLVVNKEMVLIAENQEYVKKGR